MQSPLPVRRPCAPIRRPRVFALATGLALAVSASAAERLVGDLDADGELTVLDLVRQLALARGQTSAGENEAVYADVDHDGVFNDTDSGALVRLILGTDEPAALPLATVRGTAPTANATNVALTREFVVHFTMPLALNAVVSTHNPNTGEHGHLSAEFGGTRLLTRAELSSDRRKATLFFLEPLPASARIRVTFDPVGLKDLLGREVDGNGDGAAGGIATFDFDTLGIAGLENVGVVGRVYGVTVGTTPATPVPLAGVTITVDGAEQTLRTTTGADGRFVLTPAPAGRFFVLIDGRTAPGSGANGYYAFVGKAWEGVPGVLDTPVTPAAGTNAAGDIFLPFIPSGTLQPVSAVQDTTITFAPSVLAANPQLAGVAITVPPNSLFADNGARGGSVGIAPVAPDKLPEPLPTGLTFPLVITIQTDGATNFDRPVPVRFPNLPDPDTGVRPAPGEKSALWSFNHDTGLWEIQGPMTVTDDGLSVVTDPGVGVRQPGWHGSRSGTQGNAPPPVGPPGSGPNGDSAPPPPPKCPERSGWEWANLLYDVGAQGMDCAGNFNKVASGIRCVTNLLSSIKTLYSKLSVIEHQLRTGSTNKATIRAAYEALKADYQGGKGFLELQKCIETFDPAKLAVGIYNCIGNVLDAIGNICDFTDAPAGSPEECKPPKWTRKACKGVAAAKLLHAHIKSYIDLMENAKKNMGIAAIEYAFSRIDSILGIIDIANPMSTPGKPGERAMAAAENPELTPEEVAEILSLLGDARTNFSVVEQAAGVLDRIPQELTPLESAVVELGRTVTTEIAADGERFEGRYFYRLEFETLNLRGTGSGGTREPLILPPDAYYVHSIYEPNGRRYGSVTGKTGRNGTVTTIATVVLNPLMSTTDTDQDQLPDLAESVIGTSPSDNDSDDDGLADGAEVANGTDPLSGRPAATGIVAIVDTPGIAQDVAAANNLVAIADGPSGVILFNAADALNPVRVAQVDTPGSGGAVAFGTGVLAVADGVAGLAVVDVTDPPAAGILHQITFGAAVNGVVTDDTIAHVALANGFVASVDLASGTILERRKLGAAAIQDVALGREALYALAIGTLYTVDLDAGSYGAVSSVAAPGPIGVAGRRLRLAPGGDRLFHTHTLGVNVFSLANPLAPTFLKQTGTGPNGWNQFVPNGSGLGLGAVGLNSDNTGGHDLSLYRIASDDTLTFQTTFPTPGIARAVAIDRGLAYVADGANGLEVVNYLAADTLQQPPTIALAGTFTLSPADAAQVEEGKLARVTATVTDDVQVRNVEFLIDGQLVTSDGGFPFELRFTTPQRSALKTSFTLQARAFDTGGNRADTLLYTIQLVTDATPPSVLGVNPANHDIVGPIESVLVSFSEPLDPLTVTSASLELRALGADCAAGTGDDVVLSPPIFAWRDATNTVAFGFAAPLAPGVYRVTATGAITDLAGNHLLGPVSSSFTIFSQADRDRDGVPDDLETLLGLDPDDPDSDGDGLRDGKEDFDNDGLGNAAEIAIGTDPTKTDTNNNGIGDADEDGDGDALTNLQEAAAGTDVTKADTDADGWNDETEVADGTDPLSAASRPPRFVREDAAAVAVARLGVDTATASATTAVVVLNAPGWGPATARPPTAVVVLSAQPTGNPATEPNLTTAKPPVHVEVPAQ